MTYLRRRYLRFDYDEWARLPWWLQNTYDEMLLHDLNNTLEAYRMEPDPPPGEPFVWSADDYDLPRSGGLEPSGEDVESEPLLPGEYDFPMETEADRIAPVSYLPIERLGARIRKSKVTPPPA